MAHGQQKWENYTQYRQEPMPCYKKVMNSIELKCNKSMLPSLTGINIVSNNFFLTQATFIQLWAYAATTHITVKLICPTLNI